MRSKAELGEAISKDGRAVLIVNARSRRGGRNYEAARALLLDRGFTLLGAFPVTKPKHLPRAIGQALDLAPDLVVVGGGDGTLATAVGRLAHLDIAMGVLPLGTTNNFARSLGVPMSLAGAIRVLREGKVADVDLGQAEDEIFANMASFGLSVEVASRVPPLLKRVIGRPAYMLTAARSLPGHHPFHVRMTVDGVLHEFDTHQLNIANGAFHHGLKIASDATPDNRRLSIYRLGDSHRLQLTYATLRHVIFGPRRTLAEHAFLSGSEITVETDPPLPLSVDGEVRLRTPVRVSLAPNALRVMVPMEFDDT
ncbi:diacylglycerol/lipid kinase family protein [Bailinhaonella thermotolerans]|uniref:YegS/Rv2252/BmrU family lipid kinase n=1 Tax=Bailinhaonella thermotolerans TaxID=1070861 RepID=A0A3A4B9R8_9ACTN|nr:YegS/Rv2252/BmrU family lipid kinase [Bailinhaonella thermotolerans]RJL34474.1 YegS/Rv2252/BmrU family lipid kinase [Bailinhaonella thermotolerans]